MAEPFSLSGTREVIEGYDPPRTRQLIEELERAVDEDSPFVTEASKALVESICKTILNDRGIEFDDRGWDMPQLFRETLIQLRLFPDGYPEPGRAQDGLTKVIRGLQQVVQGLSEIRNLDNFIAHGIDGYEVGFDRIQRVLAARAADTIVYFLYSAHTNYALRDETQGRIYYKDHEGFNDFLDDTYPVYELGQMEMLPSRILYNADPEHQAYREVLIGYKNSLDE
jgi:hypothetical protein